MNKLKTIQDKVQWLQAIGGMSYREIAGQLDCSKSSIDKYGAGTRNARGPVHKILDRLIARKRKALQK